MIKINTEVNGTLWNNLIHSNSFASPFQTPAFYDFYNSMEGFSADVFALESKGEYKALVVVTVQKEKGAKAYFSRRGIIYGGPLLTDMDSASELLLQIIKFYKKKLIYLETRNFFDYSSYKSLFISSGFQYIPWLNFHLDIGSNETMKKQMSSSRWRQIKKAIKNGASWKEATSEDEVKEFYNILSDLYRTKIKKPLFPLSFFTEFYRQNAGKFLLISYEDKIIGGIMCPIISGKAIYEFYVCGLDTEYKNQYPSVMATWAAMEYAAQNDIPIFDFMGAGSPDESYGVREFKSRFGGREVAHGRFLNILNPALYKTGKLGLQILSKIK